MKQFFKFVFASMLGVFLSILLFFVILVAGIGAIVSKAGSDDKTEIAANTILHIDLKNQIDERGSKSPFDNLNIPSFEDSKTLGLNDIIESIKQAKDDDNIKGIYLDVSYVMAGMATVEEIRNALIDFKKSGKFIISYSEVYTQTAYYLASVADKIYLNPVGVLEFKGFSSETMFLKGALAKLEIEPQIIKVGTYKSAVEPLILDKMSDANRLQVSSLLNTMFDHFTSEIAKSRKLNVDSVRALANGLKTQEAPDAVKYKLADGLKYKDEVLAELKKKTNTNPDKDLVAVSLEKYANSYTKSTGSGNERIAIIYASGEITGGEGDDNTIGSERISRAIRKARTDEKVKAIVLRVNSPGGSSLASDVIWREVVLTKKTKPVIVSMGDLAASGGYYIACAADSIFAQPNTITGSIGVFAIIPNMKGFFNNKLGITFDGVKTGAYSDLGNVARPLTEPEKLILQKSVNNIYSDFTGRVADGRKKSKVYIDSIGQGRVWSGSQAMKLGLVDRLGNINDAIKSAAKKAKLKEYKLVEYPAQKDVFASFMDESTDKIKTYFIKQELGDQFQYYQKIKSAANLSGIQTRMPFDIIIK